MRMFDGEIAHRIHAHTQETRSDCVVLRTKDERSSVCYYTDDERQRTQLAKLFETERDVKERLFTDEAWNEPEALDLLQACHTLPESVKGPTFGDEY